MHATATNGGGGGGNTLKVASASLLPLPREGREGRDRNEQWCRLCPGAVFRSVHGTERRGGGRPRLTLPRSTYIQPRGYGRKGGGGQGRGISFFTLQDSFLTAKAKKKGTERKEGGGCHRWPILSGGGGGGGGGRPRRRTKGGGGGKRA